MDMAGPYASSEKSLEETLYQCVEDLKKKKRIISCVVAKPASMFFPLESPNSGNEASPNLHHERGFKGNASKVTNEKMGPRQGAVSKHRQQRHTSKGSIKVYPADPSNFRALVYEHTSQLPSAPPPDVAAQPTSPLTPNSITSTSSTWGFMSQPSSPTTSHSIRSSSPSPLSSPHHGHSNSGMYLNSLVHAEHRPHLNTHLNVPNPFEWHAEHSPHLNTHPNVRNPFEWHAGHSPHLNRHNNVLNPHPSIHNTDLHQSNCVPRCASTPCLGVSNQAGNAPSDNGRPQGISLTEFERVLSLRRFLMDDDAVCNAKCISSVE